MTVEELRAKVDAYQKGLKEKSGQMVMFSETGPASIGLIKALVDALETQKLRTDQLERKVAEG